MYVDDEKVMDIKSYLSRPQVIGNFTYNNPTRGLIASVRCDTLVTKAAVKNFSRIEGCYGWRASFCYRIQAVATPFQAGRVRLAFYPFEDFGAGYDRASSITGISQLPGIDLDLAETTSAILKVPFVFPNNYFGYNTSVFDSLGTVNLFAYTPVAVAAGATSPSFVLWHWLEDVELVAAAPNDFVAQAGKFKTVSSKESDVIPGNLSNVLSAGSRLAMWMGSKIPLISSYAGPTSWMMREASKIAASYGWSKPVVTVPVARMLQTSSTYQHLADGADTTYSLGAFVENSVQPLPGFAGTDVDEMAFSYIKSVYSAISAPTFTVNTPVDSVIYSCQLTPRAMFFQNGAKTSLEFYTDPTTSIWPSSLMGLSIPFRIWRGGFKFRIKMSKTKFHTGRLLLGFVPLRPAVSIVNNLVPVDRLAMQFKSEIWDLREGNVMEFDVPFIAPQSWLVEGENYGTFFISVIEPLQGPETVSPVVPFVVEVAGADDMEFAFPVSPTYWPAPLNAVPSAQSGGFQPYSSDSTVEQAANCIGEKFNSVKQLISKGAFVDVFPSGIFVFPRTLKPPIFVGGSTSGQLTQLRTSWRGYFNFFYGLERGGLCYHATGIGRDCTLSATIKPDSESPFTDSISASTVTENSTALHIKVPFYSKYSRILTSSNVFHTEAEVSIFVSGSSSATKATIMERAADDFQFGYYLGAPMLSPVQGFALPLNDPLAGALGELRS